jgi:molybdopterin/thiamine biosynthesis adenylyltransferase
LQENQGTNFLYQKQKNQKLQHREIEMDFSRNKFFIPTELQNKIAEKTLLICGTGMGSLVAEMAIRTGFKKIILADGDTVDESNLNRQNFTLNDINVNKALAIQNRLLDINPDIELVCLPYFLESNDLRNLIPQADLVINTIDFDSPAFLECHQLCKKYKKYEFFPTNVGFGGSLIVVNQDSPCWEDYFDFNTASELKGKLLEHLVVKGNLSPFMIKKYIEYQSSKMDHDPQMATATLSCTQLIITALVQVVAGENVKVFPEVIIHDPLTDLLANDIKVLDAA